MGILENQRYNNHFDETPKYRKKKSKSGLKRSKHKHKYEFGWIKYLEHNPFK